MNKGEAFKTVGIQELRPDEYLTLTPECVEWFGEGYLRARISMLNTSLDANFKTHGNKDRSITIWYNPAPRIVKSKISPAINKLLELRTEFYNLTKQLPTNGTSNADTFAILDKREALQVEIDLALADLKRNPVKTHKGNAVHQTLDVILAHLHLTKEDWELCSGRDKTQLRVQAEIEIRNAQRNEEKQ